MAIPLLDDLLILFCVAIPVVLLCHRLRIPAILGFLLSGVVAGPHALGLIRNLHEVEILAEIGVVLLMFTIGIEFSLTNLLRVKRAVLIGGGLQCLLTVLAAAGIGRLAGLSWNHAVFAGFLLALSSTAIVLRLLQDRAEIDAPHGRSILAILIFQDILVAPLMLFVPFLAGGEIDLVEGILLLLFKSAAVVALIVLASRYLVPWIMFRVAGTRSRETFLLTIAAIGLAVAWLTSSIGLSVALGAFLAGLIISESEYSHHALSNILPFRDLFASLFFISIGMLFDLAFFARYLLPLLGATVLVYLLKALLAAAAMLPLRYPRRTALLTGLALGQVGEFSFVLSKVGQSHGLVTAELYQGFLAVSLLTMGLTPFVIVAGPPLLQWLQRGLNPERVRLDPCKLGALNDHIVIIGYGPGGQNLALAARQFGLPYAIIDMNPSTVRRERQQGTPIYFGDAAQPEVLHEVAIQCARAVVVGISDPVATRQILVAIRQVNPSVHLIARTPYQADAAELVRLGADEVVIAELEASILTFATIMERYLIPREEIERFVAEVRQQGYAPLRDAPDLLHGKAPLPGVEIVALEVAAETPLVGQTLAAADLRRNHGVTILAIRRGRTVLPNPEAAAVLAAGDVLMVMGEPFAVARLALQLRTGTGASLDTAGGG